MKVRLQSRMVKPTSQIREMLQGNGHATPAAGAPAPVTSTMPATPKGAGKERVFAGNGPAYNNAARTKTGLSCV